MERWLSLFLFRRSLALLSSLAPRGLLARCRRGGAGASDAGLREGEKKKLERRRLMGKGVESRCVCVVFFFPLDSKRDWIFLFCFLSFQGYTLKETKNEEEEQGQGGGLSCILSHSSGFGVCFVLFVFGDRWGQRQKGAVVAVSFSSFFSEKVYFSSHLSLWKIKTSARMRAMQKLGGLNETEQNGRDAKRIGIRCVFVLRSFASNGKSKRFPLFAQPSPPRPPRSPPRSPPRPPP